MYAAGCKEQTTGLMYLYQGTSCLGATYTYDWNDFNSFHFATLNAGTYTLQFQPTWNDQDVRDYTLKLYSADKIALTVAKN